MANAWVASCESRLLFGFQISTNWARTQGLVSKLIRLILFQDEMLTVKFVSALMDRSAGLLINFGSC